MQPIHTLARPIKLFIMDVDGVLTDGSVYITDAGGELKAFYAPDGLGLTLLRKSGVTLAIISGRKARCVEVRAEALGIAHVYQGIGSKGEAFAALLEATTTGTPMAQATPATRALQAAGVAFADAVVVGSRIIEEIEKSTAETACTNVKALVADIRRGVDEVKK